MNIPWTEISNLSETHLLSRQANKFIAIELIIMRKKEGLVTSILVTRNFQEFKVINKIA
jgi:hypothetical protein